MGFFFVCLFLGWCFFFGFGPPASSIVMGRASKVRAWAEPKPEAWSLSLRLDPPYRWVEPAKPKLEQPFQVSSLSRARADPQAWPITSWTHPTLLCNMQLYNIHRTILTHMMSIWHAVWSQIQNNTCIQIHFYANIVYFKRLNIVFIGHYFWHWNFFLKSKCCFFRRSNKIFQVIWQMRFNFLGNMKQIFNLLLLFMAIYPVLVSG